MTRYITRNRTVDGFCLVNREVKNCDGDTRLKCDFVFTYESRSTLKSFLTVKTITSTLFKIISFFCSFQRTKVLRNCLGRNHIPLNDVILVRDIWLINRQKENEVCYEILLSMPEYSCLKNIDQVPQRNYADKLL